MASFGVDIWNPINVGSHSTDEQLISWSVGIKENSVCKGGNVYGYRISIKVSGKIEGATSETTAHSTSIMIKIVLEIKIYYKRWINE